MNELLDEIIYLLENDVDPAHTPYQLTSGTADQLFRAIERFVENRIYNHVCRNHD